MQRLDGRSQQVAELAGREVDGVLEGAGEVALVKESAALAHLAEAQGGRRQQLLRFGDPDFREKLLEAPAGFAPQPVDQRGDAGPERPGGGGEHGVFLVVGLQPVDGPLSQAQALGECGLRSPEEFLDPPGHRVAAFLRGGGVLQAQHVAGLAAGGRGPRGAPEDVLARHHRQQHPDVGLELGQIPVAGHEQLGQVLGHELHGALPVVAMEERDELVGVAEDVRR